MLDYYNSTRYFFIDHIILYIHLNTASTLRAGVLHKVTVFVCDVNKNTIHEMSLLEAKKYI